MGQGWSNARRTLVGKDVFGNRYYEQVVEGKRRRWFKPPGMMARPMDYDVDRVPANWRSWLTFQRPDVRDMED
ncbi:hypothetical protein PSACC_03073 [Paramicrosporidium saccamoebae]|uniref:NADH dehydrogenase [ubiquinone] 1 alpha subcomplex subunit n=1 Tax=Paramicrosporidium saccamoebae TaxID=1246581 RepID=A0A2H9THD7_9FUNG|nr:hypothetical protein PSACC_03073 [Paramicrosporidium saccamoebae]